MMGKAYTIGSMFLMVCNLELSTFQQTSIQIEFFSLLFCFTEIQQISLSKILIFLEGLSRKKKNLKREEELT